MPDSAQINRRHFLKGTVLQGAGAAIAGAPIGRSQSGSRRSVAIVIDPADPVASAAPVQWAARELQQALADAGVAVSRHERVAQAGAGEFCIVASGLRPSHPVGPECLALASGTEAGRQLVRAGGSDVRGAVYALLELADRVRFGSEPMAALQVANLVVERPANAIRGIERLFTSDVEDKPWFNDREMWPPYLTMLAAQRFNRFNLSLGLGYDFLREVTDAYFLFAYPFLLSVPGYNVRAAGLSDAERDSNLAALKFIGEEAAARGLHFQLGIWMHGYQWIDSPHPNYTIEGLTAANHGPYCRDALAMLLKACPAIQGVTFRIHGESGVAEGSYDFWKTVFDGVKMAGRKIEIDMHAKGIDQGMIDVALATGMPVKVSPKYWAEHMGMPYHQAAIREQEVPRDRKDNGFFALSSGSRSFLRYGYGDLLREDRRYGVLHRIWPGTQRLLLWGDPVTAAAYSRAFGFCGSDGVEIMEPLSFKGRRGSGIAGGRCGYADASLKPRWDWQKYLYSYRVWGRYLYNPDTDPEACRRYLRTLFKSGTQFKAGAPAVEAALANASRILPIVTTAHLPSAANNTYWPEIYTNQPMVDAKKDNPYGDTPSPKTFQNSSPLDPQLFSRMSDFADELLKGERGGKYSPVEVAQWLEDLSAAAMNNLAQTAGLRGPEYSRLAIDVDVQIGLGRFFAAKFRAGVLYAIHERTGDRAALEQALKTYRDARAIWARIAARTKGVYVADITVGEHPWLRGHWSDRLPAIDDDIARMEQRLESAKTVDGGVAIRTAIRTAIEEALGHPSRDLSGFRHKAPAKFHPKEPLPVEIAAEGLKLASARLYYRHVNQGERWQSADMQARGGAFHAAIPAEYTNAPFPLQYYFELKGGPREAWLYPGFKPQLTNQPYFVVRQA
jgi:hypothetical protein